MLCTNSTKAHSLFAKTKAIKLFLILILMFVSCVQHQLECALLGLGQFQNTLDELHTWLARTAQQLQGLQTVSIDLQGCEIELAKHKVSASPTTTG